MFITSAVPSRVGTHDEVKDVKGSGLECGLAHLQVVVDASWVHGADFAPKMACMLLPTTTTPAAPIAVNLAGSALAGSTTLTRKRVMHEQEGILDRWRFHRRPSSVRTPGRGRARSAPTAQTRGPSARARGRLLRTLPLAGMRWQSHPEGASLVDLARNGYFTAMRLDDQP